MELINLAELDRELGLDDDPLDDFDDLDGGDSAAGLPDLVTRLNPDTLTRREIHGLKERLWDLPAAWALLDEMVLGDDDGAERELAALADEWHLVIPGPSRKPSSGDLEAFAGLPGSRVVKDRPEGSSVRQCQDCDKPARPRKSANGPWPQRCEEHAKARKKWMDAGGSKARPQYRPCCVDWQMDDNPDHRGLCLQCRDARKASRRPVSDPVSACESAWLISKLGPSGWNIQKPGWLRE